MAESRKIFVNLPVTDLAKSVEFFGKLGFDFNKDFTDDRAACMIVSDEAFVMLLSTDFFKTFTQKEICDSSAHAEAILAISAESRDAVEEIVNKALEAGGQPSNDPSDQGFMYGWSFQDLDGHSGRSSGWIRAPARTDTAQGRATTSPVAALRRAASMTSRVSSASRGATGGGAPPSMAATIAS